MDNPSQPHNGLPEQFLTVHDDLPPHYAHMEHYRQAMEGMRDRLGNALKRIGPMVDTEGFANNT